MSTANPVKRLLARMERARSLDGISDRLRDGVAAVTGKARVDDLAHGTWLGHPLHPAAVHVPIGAWLSAALLDLLPGDSHGQRRSATVLLAAGTAAALPAAVVGAVDWTTLSPSQRRVGLVHAAANSVALVCFAASVVARLGRRHRDGRVLSYAGLGVAGASAFLGGHLAYSQAAGVNYGATALPLAPKDWRPVGAVEEFPDATATARTVGDLPIIVYRASSAFTVLIGRCGHLSGPLAEGRTRDVDGEPCIECPWHGSVFRLRDGTAVNGPASSDQPTLDTRLRDGRLEVRQP